MDVLSAELVKALGQLKEVIQRQKDQEATSSSPPR
jgi:hypothetical protein